MKRTKTNKPLTHLTSHVREGKPGRCRDVGRTVKMVEVTRIKEREQISRCGNRGQTVGKATAEVLIFLQR